MKGDEILFEKKNHTIFIRKVLIFSTHAKTPWRCRLLCPHPVFHKSYRSLRVTRIPVTSWQTNNALTIFSVSFAVTRWGYRIPAINEDNAAASVQSPCRSQHFRILPCAFCCKDAGKNRIYMPIDWCRYIYTTLTWHKIWLLLIQSLMLMINKHKHAHALSLVQEKVLSILISWFEYLNLINTQQLLLALRSWL